MTARAYHGPMRATYMVGSLWTSDRDSAHGHERYLSHPSDTGAPEGA